MSRHLLCLEDLGPLGLSRALDMAEATGLGHLLEGKSIALFFEHPSARTRNAFEAAVFQLGGHPVTIRAEEIGIDSRESAEDVARTLACFHSVICGRVASHSTLDRMATALDRAGVAVPVVNLLSDLEHPSQAVADLLTLRAHLGELERKTLTYVGDHNNVSRSLVAACALVGMRIHIAGPPGYQMGREELARASARGAEVQLFEDPFEAATEADAIYTDVWTSMGQESERSARLAAFAGYTVDEDLVALAASDAIVLHCLPAHRGEEITAGVLEGPRSAVWEQAANRMHAMRGVFTWLAYAGLREPLDDPVTGRSIPAPGPGGADHRGHR